MFLSPILAVASVYQLEEINSKKLHLASRWTPHPSFSLRCFLFQFQPFLGELHLIALGVKMDPSTPILPLVLSSSISSSIGNLMIIPQQSDDHHITILWSSMMRLSSIFICSSAIVCKKTNRKTILSRFIRRNVWLLSVCDRFMTLHLGRPPTSAGPRGSSPYLLLLLLLLLFLF